MSAASAFPHYPLLLSSIESLVHRCGTSQLARFFPVAKYRRTLLVLCSAWCVRRWKRRDVTVIASGFGHFDIGSKLGIRGLKQTGTLIDEARERK